MKGTNDCVKFEGEPQEGAPVTSTSFRDSPLYACVAESFTSALASPGTSQKQNRREILLNYIPFAGQVITFLGVSMCFIKQMESGAGTALSDTPLMKRNMQKGNN